MHSGSTGRRAERRKLGNLSARLAALTLLLVVLVACGTGNAEESQTYEQHEATRQAQMPIVQATTTARFFAGTPVVVPTPTPIAVLADLALATSVKADGSPQNEVRSAGGGTIYASAKVHSVTKGTVFTAVWGKPDGTEIARTEVTADASAGDKWFSFSWDGIGGQPSGDYAVFIYADGMLIGSLAFSH
jgi:hypothetical protein